jgi:hypothetical protein
VSFDLGRLQRSDRLIGAGAVALLVAMFLFKWYGVSTSASVGGLRFTSDTNGWQTFTNSRWLWLVTIVVALAFVWTNAAQLELCWPVAPSLVVSALGGLSTIFIVFRIINHHTAGASETVAGVHYSASAGIEIGIWLGLIAAAAITFGGYLAMQPDGSATPDGHERRHDADSAFSGLLASPPTPASDRRPSDQPPAGDA